MFSVFADKHIMDYFCLNYEENTLYIYNCVDYRADAYDGTGWQ